jgi:hypothetical protein
VFTTCYHVARQSGNIQGTSGNNQETSRELQGTLVERSGNVKDTSGHSQGTLRELQETFREHSGHIEGTLTSAGRRLRPSCSPRCCARCGLPAPRAPCAGTTPAPHAGTSRGHRGPHPARHKDIGKRGRLVGEEVYGYRASLGYELVAEPNSFQT